MFENTVNGAGAYTGYGTPQGYSNSMARSRSRTEGQEERFVEGDLFGSAKRPSLRSTDPPTGQAPRPAYYDGAGLNGYSNASTTGGYGQRPTAQASPFARRPAQPNGYMLPGRASTGGTGVSFSGEYSHASEMTNVQGDIRSSVGSSRALVPVDSSGGVMDKDDDDGMPTRSLADADNYSTGGIASEGMRHRRGGESRVVGGGEPGLERVAGSDLQKATWITVWGVPPGMANDVLTRFLQFGHIEEQRGMPGSNWLYLKYATRLQADKALAAGHGSRLTDAVMLGVQKVSDEKVWRALSEGRVPAFDNAAPLLRTEAPKGRSMGARTPNSSRTKRDAMDVEDSDLVERPPQSLVNVQNVCNKVMGWFGFY